MTSRGGSSSSNGGGGLQSIPATSRKMVQSLKEIVKNSTEPEIYAMLKECNMDPNEAVSRLLSQDPFREVKSKKEKRKENKDTADSRSRGGSHTSRGGKGATDRYVGRGGSASFNSYEPGVLHGKPAYKKESGTSSYTNPSSVTFESSGSHVNRQPALHSATVTSEVKPTRSSPVDSNLSSSQPAPGHQSAWSGVPGQLSMAEIVKMGRPQAKTTARANASQHASKPQSYVPPLNTSEVGTDQQVSQNDEWPRIEPPAVVNVLPPVEAPSVPEVHTDASNYHSGEVNQLEQSLEDNVSDIEEPDAAEYEDAEHVESVSVSARDMDNVSADASLFRGDMHKDTEAYQPHISNFEHPEVEDQGASVSSVTSNLQQLNVKEVQAAPHEEDTRPVIIPDHLQVQSADFHLSFGSFGTGSINSAFPGQFSSAPSNSNIEQASVETSTVEHSEARNSDFYGEEPLRSAPDSNLVHRTTDAGRFESPSTSPNEMNQNSEASHEIRYTFPSAPNYNYENAQQLNSSFPHSDASSQMQNLASYSTETAYTNSLPSSLLAHNVQSARESELPYSPFQATQSNKYGNTMSSISGSSVPEGLKPVGFSSSQPTAQALSGGSVATGPALPQHLAVHPYSQAAVPLGPFPNMISYPFLPQNYTYMPSAFQQAFAGNSTYHQTLAAMLPQYKNSVSVSSLPQSAAIPSGYGGFGSSASIPGNFQMNPQAAAGPTTIGYEELLSSQYKDNSNLMSLQQNENSGMWVHGPGSRTMPAVPANTFYNFQGQSQQPSGFRQPQQPPPSQSYASPGYPNFYHSQTGGISLDHHHHQQQQQQQQNPRDGSSLGGAQGQSSKQSQQLWQNGY